MDERKRVGLRIPYELNTYLVLKAREQGLPKNALILQILWEWTEKNKSEKEN